MTHIPREIVGVTAGPLIHEVDTRWLMAFAAGIDETAPIYLDTLRPEGIVAHPLFPVCYEWPVLVAIRTETVPDQLYLRSVHATHDMTIHRLPRAGEQLATTATIVSVEARKPGAYLVTRLETVDGSGGPVTATDYGTLYLGVEVEGPAASPGTTARGAEAGRHPLDTGGKSWEASVSIPGNLAHVYSECSRIWNPIHTDREVAVRAGLPDIILHGTATLALAISRVLGHEGEDPGRVRRIACRFRAMVLMPSIFTIRGSRSGEECHFRVVTAEGRPAVEQGLVTFGSPRSP